MYGILVDSARNVKAVKVVDTRLESMVRLYQQQDNGSWASGYASWFGTRHSRVRVSPIRRNSLWESLVFRLVWAEECVSSNLTRLTWKIALGQDSNLLAGFANHPDP